MESQCIRVKLRPGKTQQFVDWAKTLSTRPVEVRAALIAEGMSAEFLFLERCVDGDYVILYTRAKDLMAASKSFEQSNNKIDTEAKEVMAATWDFSTATQVEKLLEVTL